MRRFWARLAVQLGKRGGVVSIVGLLVTVGLGLGITKLKFATGQDAYLNGSDQVSRGLIPKDVLAKRKRDVLAEPPVAPAD